MRLSNGANGTSGTTIGRRRGTRRKAGASSLILNRKSLVVLLALCGTIFSLGLIVGTRVFDGAAQGRKGSGKGGDRGDGGGAEVSPLHAATAKLAPSDAIQTLILESAQAERFEKEERRLEREARARGDTKLAAHLRGALAPGDTNYNPHRHVDDFVGDAGESDEGGDGAAGDGAMYGGDGDEHNMHNHFVEALKNDVDHLKQGKDKVVQRLKDEVLPGLKDKLAGGLRHAQELVHPAAAAAAGDGGGGTVDDPDQVMHGPADGAPFPYRYLEPAAPDHDFTRYAPKGGARFVEYKDGAAPYKITRAAQLQSDTVARSRRTHVLGAMQHIWTNYKKYAFGKDELHPITKRSTSNWGGMGTTLVDSLDTLWLMGLKDEFYEGRDWVRDHLEHSHVGSVSGFETTIRSLGGLLAAYDLSHDPVFLQKADDLGSRLVKAYDTPSGLPHGQVNLGSGRSNNFSWNSNAFILAEVATQQVEYRYLARITGKTEYAKKSERVFEILHEMQPADGLLFQNIRDGNRNPTFVDQKVSFGAMGDSAYEYMLKMWVQGGKKEPMYREMWDKAMNGVHEILVQKSYPSGLTFLADRNGGRLDRKMDHLACFMGGALALGAYTDPRGLDSVRAQRDLKTAKALTYTCYQMYARTKTGISPEFMNFKGDQDDMQVPSSASFYILRPEAVEAFYYLSVLTGDPIYREWGWEVFQSIERYCRTEYGYGSLHDVNRPDYVEDRMESFFMAETLKYLYLLFDPDSEIDILHKHVFNTEAHPTSIFESSVGTSSY